ncbi:MAG: hypothetical protein V4513_11265 [Pseudomonadota bacterium]
MIDEIYDRQFQLGRKQMNDGLLAGLTEFGRAVRQAFEVLNRIEYQAPWASPAERARCN